MLRFYPLAALAFVLAGAPVYAQALDVATGPAATHLRSETDKPAATSMASSRLVALYDNGPLVTATGAGAGGADVSQLQTALGLTTLGTNHNSAAASPFFLADDFTVPEGGWTIDDIEFFAYQTGGNPSASSFTSMFVQIWNGPPNDAASTVVWGDLEANVLASSAFSNIYRMADNVADPSTATTRPIYRNTATIGTTLPAGTYWVQWGAAGSLASGPWGPAVTLPGAIAPGNALLFSAGAWIPSIDGGTAQAPQDFPFVINGTGGGGTVTEEGAGALGGSLSASPNPLRGSSVVRLSVETPQEVSVAVYDMTGRKAASLFEGSIAAGQPMELDLDASALPSGVYVVRATGATVSLAQRVTVLR